VEATVKESARREIIETLSKLNADEQELLKRILKIERDKLFLKEPNLKSELINAVEDVIK
jgi:hypothetical protein